MSVTDDSTTDMPAIARGVPMPPRRGRAAKYPWQAMEIGDSFLVAPPQAATFRGQAYRAGARYGRAFTVRSEADGLRVWRTA